MATNVKVVSTDLRQTTIKVTPGVYLTEILEQACSKFALPSDKYLLKYQQKQLDLSNTFRSAGLIPGAKLELVARSKTPSAINIALDLPEAEAKAAGTRRVTARLPSDFTLWKVLRQFESQLLAGKSVNITARGSPRQTNASTGGGSGQLYYESPVLQIEQRSFSSFTDFQKTIAQLGYNSGNVLIRLSFRVADQTLVDAMADITQYFAQEEQDAEQAATEAASEAPAAPSEAPDNTATGPSPESPGKSAVQPDSQTATPDADPQGPSAVPDAMDVDSGTGDPFTPVSVFSAPSSSTPAAARTAESDEEYMPRIAHALLSQQRLKGEGQNTRLLSDQEIAEEAAAKKAKLSAIKTIEVRVRFPDNTTATWKPDSSATGAYLYQAARRVLAAPDASFKLVPAGARDPIRNDDSKLLEDQGLSPRTLVHLIWDDSVPQEVRKQPAMNQTTSSRATEIAIPQVVEGAEEPTPLPTPRPSQPEKPKAKGIPKWLKMGKK